MKALALDDSLARAHLVAAWMYLQVGEYARVEAQARQTIAAPLDLPRSAR